MATDSTGSVFSDPTVRQAIRETLAAETPPAHTPGAIGPEVAPNIDCPQCEIDQHDRCQKAEQVIVDLGVNTWICCCEQGNEVEAE
jgi:hypothetical protein